MSVQTQIEAIMRRHGEDRRWHFMTLFSCDGLILASLGNIESGLQEGLMEAAVKGRRLLLSIEDGSPVEEMFLRREDGYHLIFHFFHFLGEPVILALAHRGRVAYRRALKRVVREIAALEHRESGAS